MIGSATEVGAWIGVVATAVVSLAIGIMNHRESRHAAEQKDDEGVRVDFRELNNTLTTRLDQSEARIDELVAGVDRERVARREAEDRWWKCEAAHATTQRELAEVKARVAVLELHQGHDTP